MLEGQTRPFLQSEWSSTITNAHQLQLMAMNLGATYTLANDINLGAALADASEMWSKQGFSPIGQSGNAFSGKFYGGGQTIDGLKIASTDPNVSSIGLFGVNTGWIENVKLTDVSITANPNAKASSQYLGALVGQNFGMISNVAATGTIDGGTGSGVTAGGLVGQNNVALANNFGDGELKVSNQQFFVPGVIQNSSANVTVTVGNGVSCTSSECSGGWNYAGGLVGFNSGLVTASSASGNVTSGSNSFAGGLVGANQWTGSGNAKPLIASITSSTASGNVSSDGVNVSLGGLVGYNAPLAVIASSFAQGQVKSTANVSANSADCSANGSCGSANVGGLVGQNSGTILGSQDAPSADTGCGAGQSCATGAVSVGSGGTAGGLVGFNDGIILNAFATGNVTGAAGLGNTGNFDHPTNLGGLVGQNQGWIDSSFASGNVGTLGVAFLQAGGLVADNGGMISNSFATGNVKTGDNGQAGGLVGGNSIFGNNCSGNCIPGDGHNLLAGPNPSGEGAPFGFGVIANSRASGNVSVGDFSLAGGFVGSSGNFQIGANQNNTLIDQSSASGAVSGGQSSVLGGFVGVLDIGSTIRTSSATGPVASSGPNSIIGGFVGLSGGTIVDSRTTAAVTGTSNSFLGGFVGINIGSVIDSTVSGNAAVTASGTNNLVGGFVGMNSGLIDPSTTTVTPTAGSGNVIGGFAGANFNFANVNFGNLALPDPSFPTGTITASTTTDTVHPFIGTDVGTPGLPTVPPIVSGCTADLCQVVTLLTPPVPGTKPKTSLILTPPPPFVPFVPPPPTNNQPVLVDLTLGGGNGGTGGNGGAGGQGGPKGSGPPPGPGLGRNYSEQHFSGVPPVGETRFLPEIVVQISNAITLAEVEKIAQEIGVTLISSEPIGDRVLYRFDLNGKDIRKLIPLFEKNNVIASAQPNYLFGLTQAAPASAVSAPRDVTGSLPPPAEAGPDLANSDTASLSSLPAGDAAQYVIDKLHLAAVHRLASGRNVTVAVIDSEIDAGHPDLRGVIAERYDTTQTQSHPHSHGTGMAGAIASRYRLLGVAPGVRLLAIKAFDESASSAEATSYQILKGLDYAIAKNVRIINMSFAGPRDLMMERTLKTAHDKGIILIAAAGNAGPKSPPLFPGADPSVIAVTATDFTDKPFAMANRGKYISVAAPGVDVMVPAPGNSYQLTTGTSVAAAHVSGVAALLVESKPGITPDEVRRVLMRTAKAMNVKGKDDLDGAGLVDPVSALQAVNPARAAEVLPHTTTAAQTLH
jgi:hypothetical protein